MSSLPSSTFPQTFPSSSSSSSSSIKCLPQEVVDRIAAGEVVQRPASVVKELLENSLDAGALSVEVTADRGGLGLLQIADDGKGMSKADLPLAAVRFATSKLGTFDDLRTITTFGFRGEALASASMVSRLSILSRRAVDDVAYKCSYKDGVVVDGTLKPSAGGFGTVVRVEDLFYNLPSRLRTFKRDSDEYAKVLDVCQRYAVHRAGHGVGIVCRKASANGAADLNTKSLPAVQAIARQLLKVTGGGSTQSDESALPPPPPPPPPFSPAPEDAARARRESIAHVFGSDVASELLIVDCGEGDVAAVTALASADPTSSESLGPSSFAYRCSGLITNASYCAKGSSAAFVMFINDRLVECASLRRALESVYHDVLPQRGRPFLYLALTLPGPHVDVNVHPTKREVAFLFEDRLCDALAVAIRAVLVEPKASRTFVAKAVLPHESEEDKKLRRGRDSTGSAARPGEKPAAAVELKRGEERRVDDEASVEKEEEEDASTNDSEGGERRRRPAHIFVDDEPPGKKPKKAYDPKSLVRTISAARTGALEPFLREIPLSQPMTQQPLSQTQLSQSQSNSGQSSFSFTHSEDCELAGTNTKIDMTKPGAFAVLCRCALNLPNMDLVKAAASSSSDPTVRPKRVVSTQCSYASVAALRADVTSRAHAELTSQLRNATFVGCISMQRSLVQCGIELLMINHKALAEELFYQLALTRFGGASRASVGGGGEGIDVKACVRQALLYEHLMAAEGVEDDVDEKSTAEIDKVVADVIECLGEQKAMLNEYFSISFEKGSNNTLYLTQLPILLEGHSPAPHALPLFLLRLATEVNYSEERPCFEGVCTELGKFYSELSLSCSDAGATLTPASQDKVKEKLNIELVDAEATKHLKHTVFPAISFLLIPPKEFATDGAVSRMALLSALYKTFERC